MKLERRIGGYIPGTASEEHASQIATEAHDLIYKKYLKGALKHGGNVQRKLMVPHAIEEAVDQMVYLLTLKEQWGEMVELVDDMIHDFDYFEEWYYYPQIRKAHPKLIKLKNILTIGNKEGIVEEELEK